MKVTLQASSLGLSPQEIKDKISPDLLAEIKKKNPNPFFQAYSLVQEGESHPRVIGEGHQKILWPRKAIESVQAFLKKGVQFFKGHNADNSTSGRKPLGEVVTSFAQEISGRLHQIVIGQFDNKEEACKFDVCSIEADVDLEPAGNYTIARAFESITGIALGNSKTDTPAFGDAKRLGALQAFGADDEDEENKNKNKKEIPMNFSDVQKYIKENNVWPNQLFDMDTMKNDHTFGPIIRERDAHKGTIDDLQTKLTNKEKEITDAKKDGLIVTSRDQLEKLLPEGTTDKQKKYILAKFKPESMESLEEESLKTFIQESQTAFQEDAKLFGGDDSAEDAQKDKGTGDGKDDQDDGESTEDKVVDAILNQN